jgi:hypothetical protein
MHTAQVQALRELLAPTGWLERTRHFAVALRRRATTADGLLIVGTPALEPWHMTAHLSDESRLAGLPELMPTLVRWAPPPGAPPHLSVGLERLEQAGRAETLLVVSPEAAPEALLSRVADAKKAGTSIFALDQGDPELESLVHESLTVGQAQPVPVSFDAAQHLVSFSVAESPGGASGDELLDAMQAWPESWRLGAGRLPSGPDAMARPTGPAGLRRRLGRLLDTISGPGPQSD